LQTICVWLQQGGQQALPTKAWGDFGNDAILIELSPDRQTLTLFFVKDMKAVAHSLFERWTAGELSETVEADALPLPVVT
jgi:hypothetical protein